MCSQVFKERKQHLKNPREQHTDSDESTLKEIILEDMTQQEKARDAAKPLYLRRYE